MICATLYCDGEAVKNAAALEQPFFAAYRAMEPGAVKEDVRRKMSGCQLTTSKAIELMEAGMIDISIPDVNAEWLLERVAQIRYRETFYGVSIMELANSQIPSKTLKKLFYSALT